MNNSFTFMTPEEEQCAVESINEKMPKGPSEKTLTFLKLFARNCQVEKSLPEGLQEVILG